MKEHWCKFVVILLVVGCGSSNRISNHLDVQYQQLLSTVYSKKINIKLTRALPSYFLVGGVNTRNSQSLVIEKIDMAGYPNFLFIYGNRLHLGLPFFETKRGYGTGQIVKTIEYKGLLKNFTIKPNAKKRRYVLHYKIKVNSDFYSFRITVNADRSVVMVVDKGRSSSVEYNGYLSNQ